MALTMQVGQTDNLTLAFLDQNGKPMANNPTVDSPPSWSNTSGTAESVGPASDGLSAVLTALAEGTDTVNMTLSVDGKSFSASLDVTVEAAPQVLTSVEIVAGTPQSA